MREHRLDLLARPLRETLVAGELDRYRAVVESLSDEFDLVDIALAAISQADAEAAAPRTTTELAPAAAAHVRPSRSPARPRAPARAPGPASRARATRRGSASPRPGFVPRGEGAPPPPGGRARTGRRARARRATRSPRARARATGPAAGATRTAGPSCGRRARGSPGGPGGVTRLFVGAGRAAGMRPGDLVGAITNEAGLRGGDIGAIQIADGFSLVEVPEAAADHVIRTLRDTTIRGQKVMVRRERY